jgi:hypothetical protein
LIMYLVIMGVVFVAIVGVGVFFQSKRNDAWKQFAGEIGGEFVPGGFLRSSAVRAQAGQSTVTIDTYSVPSGDSNTTYTRLRAPFQNKDGLQLRIQRRGLVGRLEKALGTRHVDTGDTDFDRDFVVQSNNELKVQSLLLDQGIRSTVQAQRSIDLHVKDNELRLEVMGAVRDIDRLKVLYKLSCDALARLER